MPPLLEGHPSNEVFFLKQILDINMHIACQFGGRSMHLNNTSKTNEINSKSPYKLTAEQNRVYLWLKEQKLNVDDDTLNYWTRKYHSQRLVDVVKFAYKRIHEGKQIKNIGGVDT